MRSSIAFAAPFLCTLLSLATAIPVHSAPSLALREVEKIVVLEQPIVAAAPLDVGEDDLARRWGGLGLDSPFIRVPVVELNDSVPAHATIQARRVRNPKAVPNPKLYGASNFNGITLSSSEAAAPTTTVKPTTTAAPTTTPIKKYSGQATYFYQGGVAGACGTPYPDTALLVALDTRMYGNEDAVSQYCGKKVVITNTDNRKTVTAYVRDACPSCASSGSLDLSVAAFEAIGELDTGVLPITWYFA